LSLPARAEAANRLHLKPFKKTLLVFGGSLGARRLNDLVVEALGGLNALSPMWQVFHVTGPSDLERLQKAYAALRFDHVVTGYCHDMAAAYAMADVVVCRAGASTVSELAVVKRPAVLVPYPFASENHQWANALVLKDIGAVEAYAEGDLANGKMKSVLENLLTNEAARSAMTNSYGEVGQAHRNAAVTIKDAVLELGRG
jgi:UDP-N-acetylglucosamine--N-acetylmuramyl-(pentapeptide) pyrophosphoryl-undecaprenol N-acetylglucosamine transferase